MLEKTAAENKKKSRGSRDIIFGSQKFPQITTIKTVLFETQIVTLLKVVVFLFFFVPTNVSNMLHENAPSHSWFDRPKIAAHSCQHMWFDNEIFFMITKLGHLQSTPGLVVYMQTVYTAILIG